ncbi:hypothetical protein [Megasphaera cerevisiae]|uniref:hypothetical protein n=1 Tax=Megasphaera cerevisiae TaxID=39029 RepID=UPI0009F83B79|nr:hypothetical protein [Megasphaera cerevisiae]
MAIMYDMVTGIQLCFVIVLFCFTCFFYKERCCTIFTLLYPCFLFSVWAGAVSFYFAGYFFLSVLWFLLGFLIGLGVAAYFQCGELAVKHCPGKIRIRCPALKMAPLLLSIAVILFGGIQTVIYFIPFLNHSWLFNELVGFIPGIFIGGLWGKLVSIVWTAQIRQ